MINDSEWQANEWNNLLRKLNKVLGKTPTMEGILFLIGVQELGQGNKRFTKEEKQDLMHIATCKLLSLEGYYVLEGTDDQGWPHWKPAKKLPFFNLDSQEEFLRLCIIQYFEKEVPLD